MNNHSSKIIKVLATVTFVATIIIFVAIGALLTASVARGRDSGLFTVLGAVIGGAIGVLVGLPLRAMLIGFATIVAWYEAVPPGQVIIAAQGGTVANAPAIRSAGTFVPPVSAAGTFWRCQCGIRNEESSRSCTICGRDKPGTSTQVSAPVSASSASNSQVFSWLKDKRDAVNRLVDRINGDDKPEKPLATWHCSACGADHPASKGSCDVCGAAKPKAGAKH